MSKGPLMNNLIASTSGHPRARPAGPLEIPPVFLAIRSTPCEAPQRRSGQAIHEPALGGAGPSREWHAWCSSLQTMRSWLTLALVSLPLAGCFDSHGLGGPAPAPPADAGARDAGPLPPVDGGSPCRELPSRASELQCPERVAIGEPIAIAVTHSTGLCCGDEGAREVAVARGEGRYEILTRWDACDCCELCECVGAPATRRIDLAAPTRAGVVTVIAGDHTCRIAVGAGECEPTVASAAHAPVTFPHRQPVPVLLERDTGAGCACVPRAMEYVGREGPLVAALELCDCSDDFCLDGGYQATAHIGRFVEDWTEVETTAGVVRVQRVDPALCHDGGTTVRGVEVVGPRVDRIASSDLGVWLRLDLEAYFCCVSPASLVEERPGRGTIDLAIRDCNQFECDCLPSEPTRWSHWHWLGELGSGEHVVQAGAHRVLVTVP